MKMLLLLMMSLGLVVAEVSFSQEEQRDVPGQQREMSSALALVVSSCEFKETRLSDAVAMISGIAAREHPNAQIPKVIFLDAPGAAVLDDRKVTMSLEKVPLGEALEVMAIATGTKMRARGNYVFMEASTTLDATEQRVVFFKPGVKVFELVLTAETTGEEIRAELMKVREGFLKSIRLTRLGKSSSFVIEGDQDEVELLQAIAVVADNGLAVGAGK